MIIKRKEREERNKLIKLEQKKNNQPTNKITKSDAKCC